MEHYDSGKMRSCAQEILSELKNYDAAKQDLDQIVTRLRNNWKDNRNTELTARYNKEAKVAAENVGKLMKQFADVLTSSADAFEKLQKQAQQDING